MDLRKVITICWPALFTFAIKLFQSLASFTFNVHNDEFLVSLNTETNFQTRLKNIQGSKGCPFGSTKMRESEHKGEKNWVMGEKEKGER